MYDPYNQYNPLQIYFLFEPLKHSPQDKAVVETGPDNSPL